MEELVTSVEKEDEFLPNRNVHNILYCFVSVVIPKASENFGANDINRRLEGYVVIDLYRCKIAQVR